MVLDASKFSPLGERRSFVLALVGALAGLVISAAGMLAIVPARRLHAAIRREACFTRHVSHELRTPLAIARNALSVVTLPDCGQEKRARNLARIDQACREIETVVETFLQLGREEGQAGEAAVAVVALGPAVEKYVEKFTRAGRPGAPHVAIGGDAGAAAVGHAPMIEMVLGNLLQNALVHGTGQVIVCLGPGVVEIRNPLSNASVASPPGHGYGLEIVRRICDHNRWRFSEHRSEGIFLARVYFRAP